MDFESDDYYVILVDENVNESGIQVFNLDDIGPSESDTIKKECEYLLSEDAVEDTKDTDELRALFEVASNSNLKEETQDSMQLNIVFDEVAPNNDLEEDTKAIKLEAFFDEVKSKINLDKVKIESTEQPVEIDNESGFVDKSTSTPEQWVELFKVYLNTMEEQVRTPPPPILKRPYKKLSDNIYKCKYCPMLTVTEKLAIKHYRYKHGEKYNECVACNSTYRRRDTLLFHETNCSAATANIMRLARESVKARRKPTMPKQEWKKVKIPCVKCNKLISRRNMSQHMKTHLSIFQRKVRLFTCDICQTSFLLKRSLEAHINAHFDRKPYVCQVCGKAFYSSNILLEHKWIHMARRFKCDLCERTYRKKMTLANHIRTTHPDGFPPILCNKCGKQITSQAAWDEHMMLHKTTQYPCPDCAKTFMSITAFNGHLKRKHGKQILTCRKFLKNLPKLKEVPGILFDVVKT